MKGENFVKHESAYLDGFTIRDSSISSWNETDGASGLRVIAGIATNCIIRYCHKYAYAACYIGGEGKLFDSVICYNYEHGAVTIHNGLLTSSVIKENSGNLSSQNSTALTIFGGIVDRCIITGNSIYSNPQASASGEAVLLNGPTAVLRNSLIADNQGNTHGGVRVLEASEVSNCTIVNNSAYISNGGLAIYSAVGTFVNNIIWGNTAPSKSECSRRGLSLQLLLGGIRYAPQ